MNDLASYYSSVHGWALSELPIECTVTHDALADHPFMWALDSFLFAGPDAHKATGVYEAHGRKGIAMGNLDVDLYKILDTVTDDGVATILLRRLV